MIKVIYKDRLGNNMFQYALGRILAEEMEYELVARPLVFPFTHQRISGVSHQQPIERLHPHYCDIPKIIGNREPRKIHLEGFFQHSQYYLPYFDKIKKWFQFPLQVIPSYNVKDSDILIYIRLGDYFSKGRHSITHQFYEDIIEMSSPDKVFIATEDPSHSFLKRFKKYNPTYLHGTPILDLLSAQLFKKIVMSSSTFAWWAAVLSNATEIYFPIAEDHFWSRCYKCTRPSIDLRIDESRYIYFYNCPTVRTWRISPNLLPLYEINSQVGDFHKKSRAFWYS
jgi:hypothetical protein